MRKTFVWLTTFVLIVSMSACKSEFEKIRVSGNSELILSKALEYYEAGKYQRAQTLFDLVLNNLRGQKNAEKAYYYYADTHYQLKQYLLAAYYFKSFANTFVTSPLREEAAFKVAYSNYLQSPVHRLDQASTLTAIEEFQVFVNQYPKSPKVQQCNDLIDELRRKMEEKAFEEGNLYFNLRQYQAAVISFDNLLRDYPESPDVERVSYLITRADFLLSQNSVLEKKTERYEETIRRCQEFLEKYPSSKYAKDVKLTVKDSERAIKDAKRRLKIS